MSEFDMLPELETNHGSVEELADEVVRGCTEVRCISPEKLRLVNIHMEELHENLLPRILPDDVEQSEYYRTYRAVRNELERRGYEVR